MPAPSTIDRILAVVLTLAGVGGLVAASWILRRGSDAGTARDEGKVAARSGLGIKLSAGLAEAYGIEAKPVRAVRWQPRLAAYGRVLPNPQATSEVHAPVSGTLRALPDGWIRIGAAVDEGQTIAIVQARFSPQERLDFQSKAAEAEEKAKGADEICKIQVERVLRLEKIGDTVARFELEQAKIQLAEAKANVAAALAQARLWRQAIKSADQSTIALPIATPLRGEVIEVGLQPGTSVEAGALIARLVDFSKVLVRMDFRQNDLPPPTLDLVPSGADDASRTVPAKATRIGAAPGVDPASQLVGHLYAAAMADGSAAWRPGLFVKAEWADATAPPREAFAVPSSAILYHQGRALVYVRVDASRYERRDVLVLGNEGTDAIVGRGVHAGENVVFQHAQTLLSEEFRGNPDDD